MGALVSSNTKIGFLQKDGDRQSEGDSRTRCTFRKLQLTAFDVLLGSLFPGLAQVGLDHLQLDRGPRLNGVWKHNQSQYERHNCYNHSIHHVHQDGAYAVASRQKRLIVRPIQHAVLLVCTRPTLLNMSIEFITKNPPRRVKLLQTKAPPAPVPLEPSPPSFLRPWSPARCCRNLLLLAS
jgi:hypothetical protein